MKTFMVVIQEYEPWGIGKITLDVIQAEDLDTCIEQLEPDLTKGLDVFASEWLRNVNGDGMNFYIIKELLPNGRLSEDLADPFYKESI